jgi:hypothetical protein
MQAVGSHRGARTIGLALAAGLVAFEAVLALGAGAVGVPGLLLVRFAEESGGAQPAPGGETVVAKLSQIESTASAEPATVALPAKPAEAPKPAGERRLEGLETIPPDMGWDREEKKGEEPQHPKAFAENSQKPEELPWDAVEPVKFSSLDSPSPTKAEAAPQPVSAPVNLPKTGDVEAWVKAKATEFKGEDRGRPLYHFEYWIEPPAEVKKRLVAVTYDFSTPAVQPQSQASNDQKTGFRVSAGGLTCADKITLTLRFDDGRSQQVAVDGCALLG